MSSLHNKSQKNGEVLSGPGQQSFILFILFFLFIFQALPNLRTEAKKEKKNSKEEKSFWWVPDVFTHGKMMWSHMVLVTVARIDKDCPEIIMQIFAIGG